MTFWFSVFIREYWNILREYYENIRLFYEIFYIFSGVFMLKNKVCILILLLKYLNFKQLNYDIER